ncbi:MATE family efflux transporter [Candidatus Haliotispira prima]|uniref:MATE family efflux transporter n=1 Tax=Candidatus Haliotispira prima TaxID=3034016 RepID=A0ABY8MGY9_9SPIO|nr:MATE family efflux transporter [Candidatus Haliotispira prima]
MFKVPFSKKEYRAVFSLALPIILANTIDTIMMLVDRVFLAHYASGNSEVVLGGSMGGGVLNWLLQAPLTGLLLYTNPMISQNFGRKKLPLCAGISVQGLYWCVLYYPGMLLLAQFLPSLLLWVGHAPELVEQEWNYGWLLLCGSIFTLLRIPLSNFFIGTNRTGLVLKVTLFGLLLNIPLDYWFIFHTKFFDTDLPGDGIQGAALATITAQGLVFLLLFICFLRQKWPYRLKRAWRINRVIHIELLRFGLPGAAENFLTTLCFNGFLLMFYSISPLAAAAGAITFSWELCNFIVMTGIGTAAATLMGQCLGAGNLTQARRYMRLILYMGLLYSGFISLWFALAPGLLAHLFITEQVADPEGLLQLSRQMLQLSALYLFADAAGEILRGGLNGAADTFAVMVVSVTVRLGLLIAGALGLYLWKLSALQMWELFIIFVFLINGGFALRYFSGRWTRRWTLKPKGES